MAILKTINKSTKTHGALRNCIEYVLQEHKTSNAFVYMTGPAPSELNWDTIYNAFLDEKKMWGKDAGRMYAHNIISFHKAEKITPTEALSFGIEFAEKCFSGYQTLISVHLDRDHIHIHLITNTVSYETGYKLHNTKKDLQLMKDFTNEMCIKRNLSIAEKGKHFDGSEIDHGEIIAWSKDKYHLLANEQKKSYVVDCAIAVMDACEGCCNKEEFAERMLEHGWTTTWTDRKKNIVFENANGDKVRDSNISKTFSIDINKEALLNEFERQNELQFVQKRTLDLTEYSEWFESSIIGRTDTTTHFRDISAEESSPNFSGPSF